MYFCCTQNVCTIKKSPVSKITLVKEKLWRKNSMGPISRLGFHEFCFEGKAKQKTKEKCGGVTRATRYRWNAGWLATVFYPFLSIRFHFQQQSHTDGATVWSAPGASNSFPPFKITNICTILVSHSCSGFVLLTPEQAGNRVLSVGQSVRCTWLFEKQVKGKKRPLHRSGCIDSDSFEIKIKREWFELSWVLQKRTLLVGCFCFAFV